MLSRNGQMAECIVVSVVTENLWHIPYPERLIHLPMLVFNSLLLLNISTTKPPSTNYSKL
jgi:hypothetical protein